MKYVAITGSLGCGFGEESLAAGLVAGPAFIGADSGSTDGGPYYLGSGAWIWADAAYERDMRLALTSDVPVIIGSCGGGGGDAAVDGYLAMVDRLATRKLRVATVKCEVPRAALSQKYADGKIRALPGAPHIDGSTFTDDGHIVAMAGAEQVQRALDTGADVVLLGRCADAAIYAAAPIAAGFDPAAVWNAAKIAECGAAAAENRSGQDSLLVTLEPDGFVLEPCDPALRCTPASVAAHTMYEVSDPYRLVMPSGVLDSSAATYTAIDDRRVRVTGGAWTPSPEYTVKLEGAAPLGFLSSFWGYVQDPLLLGQIDDWCASVEAKLQDRLAEVSSGAFDVQVRMFDGVLVVDVVGPTQEDASAMARAAYHVALHWPIKGWSGGSITAFAHPYSAPVVDRGPVYRFTLNHVAVLDGDERDTWFPIEVHEVGR